MATDERKQHLLNALAKGIRFDGRGLTEVRQVTVETDFTKSAEGSARVRIGKTEVLVGLKMAVEKPYPDTPSQGNLMVNAELRPISNPNFEPGPPGEQAIELARVIDRGIREAKAIDVKKLCIKEVEEVWSVMIDVCPINDEGNLLDAGSIGALAALKNARFPKYENKKINYSERTSQKLPIKREPLAVTVFKIGDYFIVDPLPAEEAFVDARLTIAVTKDNTICALQKGGETPLTTEDIGKMAGIALEIAPQLRSKI